MIEQLLVNQLHTVASHAESKSSNTSFHTCVPEESFSCLVLLFPDHFGGLRLSVTQPPACVVGKSSGSSKSNLALDQFNQ